ncbi:hypothetical protein DESA109040_14970 [Deinococcus saxicola]|uniref:hypothetical protein n=1 Tax=Deinococcus saxicola TaxID=249406 RepID=UPI0039EFF1DF
MKGKLTGIVIDCHTTASGSGVVKLTGLTPNGKHDVTWMHRVTFGKGLGIILPPTGSAVMIGCVATHHTFTGRAGDRAGRVVLLGTRISPAAGERVHKGRVAFLKDAVNEFTFAGFLPHAPVCRPQIGVTGARVGVRDRKGKNHYFQLEAWRAAGDFLARKRVGAEIEVRCILRTDRVEGKDGEAPRTFNVMEVQAARDTRLPTVAVAQAAD